MIRLETFAGLCNRMRALDSAIHLARSLDRELQLVWPLENNFNCRFDKLFKTPDDVSTIDHPDRRSRLSRLRSDVFRVVDGMRYDRCLYQKEVEQLRKESYEFTRLKEHRRVLIVTCTRFYDSVRAFDCFEPAEELQALIDRYTHGFDNVFGVHVRRADNARSISASPLRMFVRHMHQELEKQPDLRFFLATDSPDEERLLMEEFPGRVLVHRKRSLDRNEPIAIQDALIDLYCLAATKKIIGSYWSSFTDVAAEIGGIEKNVMRLQLAG